MNRDAPRLLLKVFTVAIFLLLPLPWSPPAFSEPLTLAQAVEEALGRHPSLEESTARVEQAREALREARASFFPHLSASVEYLRGDAPSAYLFKTIDARRLPPGVDFNDPGSFENVETSLSARWNLYRGGGDRLRHAQAREETVRREHEHEALSSDLTAAVIDTFFALLSARDLADIARQAEVTVARELELAEIRFEGGALLRSDLLSLRVRRAEARAETVRVAGAQARLAAALSALLDRPVAEKVRPVLPEGDLYRPPADYAEAVERGLQRRPEVAAGASGRRLAELERRAARGEYLPALDLQARLWHGDPGLSFDGSEVNWTAGALLSWEFFSGFGTAAREGRARAGAVEAAAAERRWRREVEREVRQAWVSLEEAEARLQVTRLAVEQAEEALAMVRTQYAEGAAEVTRLLNAELALSRMQAQAADARWARERSLSELARAVGDWAPSSREGGLP